MGFSSSPNFVAAAWRPSRPVRTRPALELECGVGDERFSAPYAAPMDQWTHVALVCDGNEARLLLQGKVIGRRALAAAVKSNDATLCIGWSVSSEEANWRGCIDEGRFWSVARAPKEIQKTVRHCLTRSEPGLVGYWNFGMSPLGPIPGLVADGELDVEFGGSKAKPGKTHPAWAPGVFADPDFKTPIGGGFGFGRVGGMLPQNRSAPSRNASSQAAAAGLPTVPPKKGKTAPAVRSKNAGRAAPE